MTKNLRRIFFCKKKICFNNNKIFNDNLFLYVLNYFSNKIILKEKYLYKIIIFINYK